MSDNVINRLFTKFPCLGIVHYVFRRRLFCAWKVNILICYFLASHVKGTRVALSTQTVFWLLLSSTVTVCGIAIQFWRDWPLWTSDLVLAYLENAPAQSFNLKVCQIIRAVLNGIQEFPGHFCQSYACFLSEKSRFWHWIAFRGRRIGGKAEYWKITVVAVVLYNQESFWQYLTEFGLVPDKKVPNKMVSCRSSDALAH